MRLDQLKYLVDIAQTGSITSTSQRFFVTQQAVSKSIKQLESGDRMELALSGKEYGQLVEGDLGKLTFQGTRFLAFELVR